MTCGNLNYQWDDAYLNHMKLGITKSKFSISVILIHILQKLANLNLPELNMGYCKVIICCLTGSGSQCCQEIWRKADATRGGFSLVHLNIYNSICSPFQGGCRLHKGHTRTG